MSAYPATALVGHRLNAFRLNYLEGRIYITIGGVAAGVLIDSLTISDRLDDVPNTLMATVRGVTPVEGAVIRVALGSTNGYVLFAGNILRVTRVWAASNPRHVLHHVEAIDPTWRLQAGLFSARYQNQSASAIAADVLTRAPAGFVPMIEAGFLVLDEISFTNATIVDALVQLATRIGGYTRVDYDGRVYLFTTPDTAKPPLPLTATHPSLAGVTYQRDLTQVITRAVVEGGGGNALTAVPVGSAVLPVDVPGWYAAGGGLVRSGPQRIAYTGVTAGGAGAFAGEGTTPASAPVVALQSGASVLGVGVYRWAYTWVTAAGETLPAPAAQLTVDAYSPAMPTPAQTVGTWEVSGENYLAVGRTYYYAFAWSYLDDPVSVAQIGPLTASQSVVPYTWIYNTSPPSPRTSFNAALAPYRGSVPAGAKRIAWFRWGTDELWHMVLSYKPANTQAPTFDTYLDGASDAMINGRAVHPAPLTGNVGVRQALVTGIAPGPGGVTARKVYRTAVNGSQLKLHSTIADNTTTALASFDNTADGALGANVPAVDTAGLVQTSKLIPAGSPSMRLTSTAPFTATGGYAVVGAAQVIRYSAATATDLTGIPATGDGALVQSVPWGTVVTAAPALLGVSGIVYPIRKGDPVNVVAVVDDPPAQTALAALVGGDGVRESLLQDGRISLTEATARGRALLAAHKDVRETVAHRSRDPNTRSGTVVTVDLPPPTDIHGAFRVQDVSIGPFNGAGRAWPTFTATSSSQRVTFEDLLRQMANTTPAPATGEG